MTPKTKILYCHRCTRTDICNSVPGQILHCHAYERHWFREKLDMIFHDHEWYRRWAGGAWISYWVDGIGAALHEPVGGTMYQGGIPGYMHAVRWQYYPPAQVPIVNKLKEPDR
jgi:hypothetical protein